MSTSTYMLLESLKAMRENDRKIFNDIWLKSSQFDENSNLQTTETQHTPKRINKRSKPRHITVKLLEAKDKRKYRNQLEKMTHHVQENNMIKD